MLAILAALETLSIPILSKIVKYKREGESSTKRLTLTEREEGLYEDTQGNLYRVEKMRSEDVQKQIYEYCTEVQSV